LLHLEPQSSSGNLTIIIAGIIATSIIVTIGTADNWHDRSS